MNSVRASSLSRMTYRLILRVHPGPFRERFGVHSCTPVVYAPSRISYPPKPPGR
jgi:hypothetical protein